MRYLPLLAVVLLTGCARYEYDIVRPPEFAGHIGTKDDYTFACDPLEYRMRTVDNRLVIRIYNPANDSITLMGGFSAAVGPDGQSHPLLTQTIMPSSFAKLIIPPPRPQIYNAGPTFGVGVGTVIGHSGAGDTLLISDPYYREPRYLTVYDESDIYYWDWKGESDVRLNLVFDHAGQSFTHEFVVHRVKM